MFDRAHAALECSLDCASGVGMTHAINVRGLRLFDGSLKLLNRELGAGNPISGRRNAARHHELYVRRAFAHFVSHGAPDLGDAVAYPAKTRAAKTLLEVFAGRSHVAVTASLRQCLAAIEDARTLDVPLFNCCRFAPVGTSCITNSRKAAKQHA